MIATLLYIPIVRILKLITATYIYNMASKTSIIGLSLGVSRVITSSSAATEGSQLSRSVARNAIEVSVFFGFHTLKMQSVASIGSVHCFRLTGTAELVVRPVASAWRHAWRHIVLVFTAARYCGTFIAGGDGRK